MNKVTLVVCRAVIAFLMLGIPGVLCAQSAPPVYTPPQGEFYVNHRAKMAYFDSLRGEIPDSILYAEGGEYNHHMRWFKSWEPRLAPHGNIEVYERLMKNYMDSHFGGVGGFKSNNDPWRELGPKRRRNNMMGIGPIRNIILYKNDPSYMLCTSSSGGLFFSTNSAESWHNAGTDLGWPRSGCQHAAFYPGDPNSWFGTSTLDGRVSYVGGIFRTLNAGFTWDCIAGYEDFLGADVRLSRMLFDEKLNASGDHTLFVGTSKGLFACTEPSSLNPSWEAMTINAPPSILTDFPGATISDAVHAEDIEYLPSIGSSTLCASMRFVNEPSTSPIFSVWRFMLSTDDGLTWDEIPDQPPYHSKYTRATVETSAAAPSSFYCLLGMVPSQAYPQPDSRVWTFNTDLSEWNLATPGTNSFNADFGAGHAFGVDQSDPTSLYVSNSTWMSRYFGGTLSYVATGHVDIEDIASHPSQPNVVWVAHHGGVDKLTVNGTSTAWEDMSDGLGVAEVDAIASSESSPDILVASWFHDGTGITRTPYSTDWDPDWAYLQLPYDGTRCLIDRWNPDHVFQSGQTGVWRRHDQATTSTASTQNASIVSQWWTEGDLNKRHQGHIYRSYLVGNGTTTWNDNGTTATHENREIEIYRSFDRAVTNEVISNFRNNPLVCKSAEGDWKFDWEMFLWIKSSPANSNHLYAALRDFDWKFRLFRTRIADHPNANTVADSWEEIPLPRHERDYPITGIAFDPENENLIYISYNSSLFNSPMDYDSPVGLKMVYRMDVSDLDAYPATGSFDCTGPEPCRDLTMNLPNTIAYQDVLAFEQGSDEGLYLSTEVGVYFTNRKRVNAYDGTIPSDPDDLNNTSGWVRLGDGLPHVVSRGIEINYGVNRIRNGLHGRGTWEHALHCPEIPELTESGTYMADDFLEVQNSIRSTAVVPVSLSMRYRAGSEVHLEPGFHAANGSKFRAFIHPCDQPGNSFRPKNLPIVFREQEELEEGPGRYGKLELFPNPTNGQLMIRCVGSLEDTEAEVRVYDVAGRSCLATTIHGTTAKLDLSGQVGMFTVVVTSANDIHVGRVIVE
ncbi:MAG: T9SS type A sorting domain-containing protein [Flavobacteriales bacterium]